MKIINKLMVIIILFALALSFVLATISNASTDSWGSGLITEVEENSTGNDDSDVSEDVGNLLGNIAVIVRVVAVATAVIILIVLAMKYMIASPGDKADVKKSMIPYVIGAFVVFAAGGIISMIIDFSSQIKGS